MQIPGKWWDVRDLSGWKSMLESKATNFGVGKFFPTKSLTMDIHGFIEFRVPRKRNAVELEDRSIDFSHSWIGINLPVSMEHNGQLSNAFASSSF